MRRRNFITMVGDNVETKRKHRMRHVAWIVWGRGKKERKREKMCKHQLRCHAVTGGNQDLGLVGLRSSSMQKNRTLNKRVCSRKVPCAHGGSPTRSPSLAVLARTGLPGQEGTGCSPREGSRWRQSCLGVFALQITLPGNCLGAHQWGLKLLPSWVPASQAAREI